jgi:tetratricopeptide (TPR) repeat protein
VTEENRPEGPSEGRPVEEPATDEPKANAEPLRAEPGPDTEALAPEGEPGALEELEQRLAEPILKGQEGIETAQVWISGFLIVIASVIAYSNAFTIPIHAVDRAFIGEAAGLRHFAVADEAIEALPGQPVAAVSLTMNGWLTGVAPAAMHGANIAFHILTAVLLYLLSRRLLRGRASEPVAMLAGLLFALHPLNTEAVNYLVGRGFILATLFSIATVLLYLRATRDEGVLRTGALAGSLICYLLAVGSHPAAVALPLLVLVADRVVNLDKAPGPRRVALWAHAGLLVVLAVTMAVLLRGMDFTTPDDRWSSHLGHRMLWLFLPHGLSAYRPGGHVFGGMLLPLLVLVLGVVLLQRRRSGAFELLWLAVFLFATVILSHPDWLTAERGVYPATAGVGLLLAWVFTLVPALPQVRMVAGLAAAVLVIAAGVATFNRNMVWQTEEDLWQDAAAKYPDAVEPQRRLAELAFQDAMVAMQEAVAQQNTNAMQESATARAEATRLFETAEAQLRKLAEAEPDHVPTLFMLGQTLEYLNRPAEAIEVYQSVLERDPEHPEALWHLAVALDGQSETTGDPVMQTHALALYERAVEAGTLPRALILRYAQSLAERGRFEDAAQLAAEFAEGEGADTAAQNILQGATRANQAAANIGQQVAQLSQVDPTSPQSIAARGQLLALQGYNLQASYLLETALESLPDHAVAWTMLGIAKAKMNAAQDFVEKHSLTPSPPPGQTSTWRPLIAAVAADGLWDAAQTYAEAAAKAADPVFQEPLQALADVAVELRQPQRAIELLQAAAEARPTDPVPWLRMIDAALMMNDLTAARTYYARAQERNAPAEELEKRRPRLGNVPRTTPGGVGMLR